MTWTVWPAGVLGPVVGWIRLSITLPFVGAFLVAINGARSQPQTWAVLAACGAVLGIAFAQMQTRRPVYAALNLMFAAMLVLWAEFWHSAAGAWWAALGGLTGGLLLFASDATARWGLSRLAKAGSGHCGVSASVEIGVLWGFVEASAPTIVGLNDGTMLRLRPGYRYAWWLGAEAKEPAELLIPMHSDGDPSAN